MAAEKKVEALVDPTYHEYHFGKESPDFEAHYSEAYHDYRRRWSENPRNFIVEDFPIHLDIEPTNICNLKCPMCSRTIKAYDSEEGLGDMGFMKWELYTKVIDEGVKYGLSSIKLNYQGEPLIHPRIVDMVKYAKDKGVVEVMFNTNGSFLTEKKARGLIEAGLDKLILSFDSPYKKQYDEIRIGAKYEKILANIKRFREVRDEMGAVFPIIRASMVDFHEADEEQVRQDFVKLFDGIADFISFVDLTDHRAVDKIDWDALPEDFTSDHSCAQIWQRLFVWWDGKVTPCCNDYEQKMLLGDANTDSLHEIWKGPQLTKWRKLHEDGKYFTMEVCAQCDHVLCDKKIMQYARTEEDLKRAQNF